MSTFDYVPAFDYEDTVLSQFANSPSLDQLLANMWQYLRQDVNYETFFNFCWNVDSAEGFGLDNWGAIVGISRLLEIPNNVNLFGFENSDDNEGVEPFGSGVFNVQGGYQTQSYELPDPTYRTLILVKALANISATSAPAINRLLQNLFPGRGNAYVVDLGNMHMTFTFEFQLTLTEFAILSQSGALPHPAGVSYSIVVVPSGTYFGFAPDAAPFNQGIFYSA